MTVQELIDHLSKMNPEADVVYCDYECRQFKFNTVEDHNDEVYLLQYNY